MNIQKIFCLAFFLGFGQLVAEVMESNETWRPMSFTPEIETGSVFDFSGMREAGPAGKDGFVVVTPNGTLAAQGRPEKRLRFFGANVCFSVNFMSHEESDALAERFLRMGYNSIRIHHYDAGLVGENDRGSNALNSYAIRPEPLERLDYFYAALRKRGMYITTDFFTYRPFLAAEVPEYGKPFRMEVKALIPLYDSAIESWKKFVSGFLDH
ncbi:MAG: glycosyl hydrolase family 5, partial [Spirochaetia bacterium]|nr:glycosyl hydrolase family 5 [Spirochaetia bacterium]